MEWRRTLLEDWSGPGKLQIRGTSENTVPDSSVPSSRPFRWLLASEGTDGGTPPPKYGSVLSSRYLCQFNADGRNFNDVITSARYAPAMILLAYNLEQGVGCGDQVQRAACFCFCICTSLYLLLLLL